LRDGAVMTEWQPIETAPKDGTDIIVMYIDIATQFVRIAFWLDYEWDPSINGWWTYDCGEDELMAPIYAPTHWMPLPEPPK